MSKFIGRTADVGIKKEAVRGTAETSATFYLPKLSLSIDDTVEQVVNESSYGVIEDATDSVVVGKGADAEIEGNIYSESFGLLLLSALGAVSTSGPSQTTVYTHTFTVGQSAQHPSLTLFQEDANQDYSYANAMMTKLEIDISLGQFAKYNAEFRAKVGSAVTLTPSYATNESNFLPQHGSVKLATDVSGLTAASAINIRSVKLTIDKGAEDDRKLGSLDPADILNKEFKVEGSIELVFNDNTFKTDMLADTAKAMRIRLTNSDVTIGSSMNPQLTIDVTKAKFSNFKRNYSNGDIVTATVDFKALYKPTESDMIEMQLINLTSSY